MWQRDKDTACLASSPNKCFGRNRLGRLQNLIRAMVCPGFMHQTHFPISPTRAQKPTITDNSIKKLPAFKRYFHRDPDYHSVPGHPPHPNVCQLNKACFTLHDIHIERHHMFKSAMWGAYVNAAISMIKAATPYKCCVMKIHICFMSLQNTQIHHSA